MRIVLLVIVLSFQPARPMIHKKKGRVESGVKYIKNNFVPLRDFQHGIDSNQQLRKWILEVAGNRTHGSTRQKPLSLFEETERNLLKPLPASIPEPCEWIKLKVYRDCHVRFNYCRYSVPYRLVNTEVWLRASETTIRIYQEHNMIALHSRINTPDTPSTIIEHLPPKASEFLQQEPTWCREQAQTIGTACFKVVDLLLKNTVVDYLRAAQGIIKLKKTFGEIRLEAACQRALFYETPKYKAIKSILTKGLDSATLTEEAAFDQLAEVYMGKSKFCHVPYQHIH